MNSSISLGERYQTVRESQVLLILMRQLDHFTSTSNLKLYHALGGLSRVLMKVSNTISLTNHMINLDTVSVELVLLNCMNRQLTLTHFFLHWHIDG